MTLNHATLIPTSHLPRTEFGMPILDDMSTNEDWWAMRYEDVEPVALHTGTLNFDATALVPTQDLVMPEGIREPDLYDEGKAVWLDSETVVQVDTNLVPRLGHILTQAKRYEDEYTSVGRKATMLHPNRYGVEVDSYYDHGKGVEAHAAQAAWNLAEKAVRA